MSLPFGEDMSIIKSLERRTNYEDVDSKSRIGRLKITPN